MKVIQLGDLHITDSRIAEFEVLLAGIAESIRAQNPDLLVFTGDLFMQRDRLSPKQVELARTFFKEQLKGLRCLLTVGNHDSTASELKTDSISAIFTGDSDVEIFNTIGEYTDIEDYRFHFWPYPTKSNLVALGIEDLSELFSAQKVFDLFQLDKTKKNILVYHGTLEGFSYSDDYKASEEALNIGKDLIIPLSFWQKFNAILAGHLHKYQALQRAVYTGCTVPLNYKDDTPTGYVIWDNLEPSFVEIPQKYPYKTIDMGDLSGASFPVGLKDEVLRRLNPCTNYDYTNSRVRVIYTIFSSQSNEIDHSKIVECFKNAKEVKISPRYIEAYNSKIAESFDGFQQHSIKDIIFKHIDDNKYSPQVKEIAEKIEVAIAKKFNGEEESVGIHFKPLKLRLSNFKCYGNSVPEIDFTALEKVVGVFGPNRMGKSTLIEAITWGLFGTTPRNKKVESVIKNGEDSTEVELEFISYNHTYKIVRKRNVSAGKLNLFMLGEDSVWVDISGSDATATKKLIERLVGTFDIFSSTTFSMQADVDRLIKKKPSERKQIILDCLQIDVLERRQEEIQELKKKVRDRLYQEKGKLDAYTEQLTLLIKTQPQAFIGELEKLLKNAELDRERIINHLNAISGKAQQYDDLMVENNKINEELTTIRKELQDIEFRILGKKEEKEKKEAIYADKSAIDRGIERLEGYQTQLGIFDTEQKRISERRSTINQLNGEILSISKGLDAQIKMLQSTRDMLVKELQSYQLLDCSRLDCPMNEKITKQKGNLRIKIDELDEQISGKISQREVEVNTLKSKIIAIEKEIQDSFYNGTDYTNLMSLFKEEERNRWKELKYSITSGVNIVESLVELIAAYTTQREELKNKRTGLQNKRTEIANRIAETQQYNNELSKSRMDLTDCNNAIRGYQDKIFKFKNDVQEINRLQECIKEQQATIEKAELYHTHCAKYQEIVGKSGVLYGIVDKAIPILQKFAKELLLKATGGTISLSIESFKTLANDSKIDEVMLYIIDNKGKRDALEASGAEKFLLSLSLRAAMAHLLSLRQNSKTELFVLDEGMGVLDPENLQVAKDMLVELGERFNRILIISHVGDLKDIVGTVINITGNSLESTFEIVKNT